MGFVMRVGRSFLLWTGDKGVSGTFGVTWAASRGVRERRRRRLGRAAYRARESLSVWNASCVFLGRCVLCSSAGGAVCVLSLDALFVGAIGEGLL